MNTRQVRMYGYVFLLSNPYGEGQPMTAGEAQALNNLRAENIGNNLRDEVRKARDQLGEGELLSPGTLAELQIKFTKYDGGYSFQEKHVPIPQRGIIEREAHEIALARVEEQVQQSGTPLEGVEREKAIALFMGLPAVQEEARARAGARSAALTETLADLL